MAGRIRSFKPELLDLEGAAALSSDAWRVWISMMLLADDAGNLRAAPKLLAAHIFHDTARGHVIEAALVELENLPEEYRVELYRANGELFAHLCGWTGGTCKAVEQLLSKLGKGRVPKPEDGVSTPIDGASIFSDTCKSIRGKTRRPSASRGESPTSSDTFRGSRPIAASRAPANSRSPIPISDPEVVVAPDIHNRAREAEPGDDDDFESRGPETPRSPPAALDTRSATADPSGAPTPLVEPLAPLPSAPAAPAGPRRRRPHFEPQYDPEFPGVPLLDPATRNPLVLDVANLSAEDIAAARAAAVRAPLPAMDPTPTPAPATDSPPDDPTPTPLPLPHGGDVEAAVREILTAAPPPLRLLVGRSEGRLASGLVGGSLRITDVREAIAAAAVKLDRRFVTLTADSGDDELEDLHRFVAGFVAAEARRRRASPSGQGPPAEPSEAGTKLLKKFAEQYAVTFRREYEAAADDVLHATEIAAELGRRLDREREVAPALDVTRARRRLVAALFEAWFTDAFARKAGHSLRLLAKFLREEPNRFRLDVEPEGRGAAGLPPDLSQPQRASISPDERAELEAKLAAIGAGATR